MNWTELVELDEKALEERGVNALGARRKMLKVFEQVKGRNYSHQLCVNAMLMNSTEAKAEGKLA